MRFKKSRLQKLRGKATKLLNSETLVGNVDFVEDRAIQQSIWNDSDKWFFSKKIDDPKFRLLKFHTIETTFRIEGKFRTCKYK